MQKLLMGNEAIALGALRAGVSVVTGYPGTPSSEIIETVAKNNDGSVYVEWSVNEKVALEVAAGAAYSGARAMVTMKQVGLNVASDPLMCVNYVGVLGGMVVVVADDPGPISSQTEQDTRNFSRYAKIACFDPSSPEEAYTMIADAFAHSEKYCRPVILRPTTRICHSYGSVEILGDLQRKKAGGFTKDSRWVIFPQLSYVNHIEIEKSLNAMRGDFSGYEKNILAGAGKKGIATGGVSYAYACEIQPECRLFKVSTFPFPEQLAREFLNGLEEVLVIEELDPVIEDELIRVCGLYHLDVEIRGKRTGHIQNAGENTVGSVSMAIAEFLGSGYEAPAVETLPDLPGRPPVLCAGCPHRASFFAVKEAAKGIPSVFTGDIGCYTLGNARPLDMVDTCLCMGAGITVAQGLQRIAPDTVHFAFIGDSTFFHSGITGVVNAVYNQSDIVVVILDNLTTAMTGNQPHPGTGKTMMGASSKKISIAKIIESLNVEAFIRVDPFDQQSAVAAVRDMMNRRGVRVILFEAPCIAVSTPKGTAVVNIAECIGCKLCMRNLGCPAISMEQGKATVDASLCTGCGLCAGTCAKGAILISGGEKL